MNIVCTHCFTTNRIPDDKNYNEGKCGKCHKTVYSSIPTVLTSSTFLPFIERNSLPIVVDYWAGWCGPCQSMAPTFNKVAGVMPTVLFTKVDTETSQQISANANIRSLPTLVFYHLGKEVDRISGSLNEMQMTQWLTQCLQKIKNR